MEYPPNFTKMVSPTPRGTQNRFKIAPGTLSGHPVASKSVPKVSRERLGSVSGASRSVPSAPWECPEGLQGRPGTPVRALRIAWERAAATNIDAKLRPGAKKSSFRYAARSQSIVEAIFRRILSIFVLFPKIREPRSVRPWPHGTGFGTCQKQSSRLREVTSKNDENCSQNRLGVSEISEIAGSSGTSRRDPPGGSLREESSGKNPPG